MALAYTRQISKTTCIGNTLSTINLNFSALDVSIVTLSSVFNTKINYLSSGVDVVSAYAVDLNNTVNANSAHWNEGYNAVYPNSANWNQGFNFYAFSTSVNRVSADTETTFALANTAVTLFDCGSFPTTALIPVSLNPKLTFTIKKIDASTNALVLSSNLPVDGVPSHALTAQYASLTFTTDGIAWWLI